MESASHDNLGCPDISDYAAIGNCHGIALITREGRVDWCALPAFDSDPMRIASNGAWLGMAAHVYATVRLMLARRAAVP